ncbi:hypothetical protein [Candidatus Nanohalovita haloferacivicina]|uniref:hypothetical protein n=1 Tax=Candidatus Nanohalovita haloferacivicina TaxID=2978046 RepID=UPI00325FD0FA|nr:hypothetical protein HBNXNv_0194 [Candidatus Nanohalobia archaeon BNXNv]
MNKKLTILAVALLAFGMAFSATAQSLEGDNTQNTSDGDVNTSESSNITVSVASKTAIDVKPESLDYNSLDVGTQTLTGDNGGNSFGSIELENIGSEYIDRVWTSATAPSDNPFGTGLPGEYDAGNFLQIKPANSSSKSSVRGNTSTYHYVNRHEYANSWSSERGDIPSYIEAAPTEVDSGVDDVYVGRFRAGSEWYFWVIPVASDDICDGSSGPSIIRVGNTAHSPDSFGTVDFTDSGPGDWREYNIVSTTGSYGVATKSGDGETGIRLNMSDGSYREYDVLTGCDTGKSAISDAGTIRTRYNVQAGDVDDLTAGTETGERSQFLLNADSANPERMLLPGEGLTVDTAIEVPQGVPQGGVSQGQITFYVTSDQSAQR